MPYYLTAQIIDTKQGTSVVGIDIPIPPASIVPVPFKVESTVSSNRSDISSIENWYKYGILTTKYLDKDYIFIRDRIRELVEQIAITGTISTETDPTTLTPVSGDKYYVGSSALGDWTGYDGTIAEWDGSNWVFLDSIFYGYTLLSSEQKEICMKLYMGNPKDHNTDHGLNTAQFWRREYHKISTPIRETRLRIAETIIENELRPYQSVVMLMITSLVTQLDIGFGLQDFSIDMHKNYWMFGVRGTIEDYHVITNPNPGVGLMDYIFSRAMFSGVGLSSMPWTPENMTMAELTAKLNDILVEGIY